MVIHKDFESDTKRIARVIMDEASNPFGDWVVFGKVFVDVSSSLLDDFNRLRLDKKSFKAYIDAINKHLKGCSVTFNDVGLNECHYISFNIEFEE